MYTTIKHTESLLLTIFNAICTDHRVLKYVLVPVLPLQNTVSHFLLNLAKNTVKASSYC